MHIQLTSKPVVFPVNTSYMLDYLKASTDEESLVKKLVERAVAAFAKYTNGRQAAECTYDIFFDYPELACQEVLKLPIRPIKTIDSIKYYDINGTATTVSNTLYHFHPNDYEFRWGQDMTFGSTSLANNRTLKVSVTAGFDIVPADVLAGLEQYVVWIYENRGCDTSVLPENIANLWNPYVIVGFGPGTTYSL